MAGKRQHYIPRLLQRGFLADTSEEAERTWLHRRGAAAKLVGIGDIGVEDWFYSRKSADGQPSLDDAITDYERDLSLSVRSFREAAPDTIVAAQCAAETVVHLVLRTAHVRRVMAAGLTRLVGEIESLFTDPVRLGAMIGLSTPMLAETTTKALHDNAAELVSAGMPHGISERLLTFLVRELGDQLVAQAVALGSRVGEMVGDIIARVREVHIQMLAQPVTDSGWVAALAAFEWTIVGAKDVILPDAVALSRAADGPLAPLLFTSGEEAEIVAMPVASDRILIGRRGSGVLDLARFNEDAAAASESFFIAKRPRDGEALSDRIGSGPAQTLEVTIAEAIREAEQARQISNCDILPVEPAERVLQNFSYSVRLADFGDAVLAKEIADIVHAVVTPLAYDMPLQDLDGLTIAVDYANALATLDRGDASLPPVASVALGYGVGVAKPVTVWRDGKPKEHLVVAAAIAEAWISPDAEIRACGLHTLVKMLAGVAHTARYAGTLDVDFKPDPMARELHIAIATTPSGYWSARKAAFIAPDRGVTYADLVIESLDFADREIAIEREKMTDPSDVSPTVARALECVSAVLAHVADWLGHRDGLSEGYPFAGSDLPQRLKDRGLDRWLELFGRDLAACYGPEGAFEFSVLTTLSRHVERLFWSFGLYLWSKGDGVHCSVNDQLFRPPLAKLMEEFHEN